MMKKLMKKSLVIFSVLMTLMMVGMVSAATWNVIPMELATDNNTNFGSSDNEAVGFNVDLTLNELFSGEGLKFDYTVLSGDGVSTAIVVIDLANNGGHIILFTGYGAKAIGETNTFQYSETVASDTGGNGYIDFSLQPSGFGAWLYGSGATYGDFEFVKSDTDLIDGAEVVTRVAIQHQAANTGETDQIESILIDGVTYYRSVLDMLEEANTEVVIETDGEATVTIETESSPTLPGGLKAAGQYVNIEVDPENAIVWPIEIKIYYTQTDLDNAGLTEAQLIGIYFWDDVKKEWVLYDDTGVNTNNVSDYSGYFWADADHLTPMGGGGDAEGPEITNIYNDPAEYPTCEDKTVNIYSTITDEISEVDIFSAAVNWRYDGSGYSTPMILVSGDQYKGAITFPSPSDGLTIFYQVCASDIMGNSNCEPIGGLTETYTYDCTNPTASVKDTAPTWQNTDAIAEVDCGDDISGCNTDSYKLHISTDKILDCPDSIGGYDLPDSQTISQHSWVCSYVEDNAGNPDFSDTPVEFKVDKVDPISSLTGVPIDWQNTNAILTLSCTDTGGSECGESFLTVVPEGNACTASDSYTGPVSVSEHSTACWKVTDNAGNEHEGSDEIKVDKTAPTTTDNAPVNWQNSDVTVALTCVDADSGCDITYYCVYQEGTCNPTTEGNSVVVSAEGENYVRYYSTDNAGNSEDVKTTADTIKIDKTNPTTTLTADPTNPDGANGWYVTPPEITLDCSNGDSGCDETYYCVGAIDCNPIITYGNPFVLTEGINYVRYYSTDNAGNGENVNTEEFKVDSDDLDGKLNGVPEVWQNTDATLTLSCTDSESGCDGTYLTVVPYGEVCATINSYIDPVSVIKHSIACWKVTDNAGNVDEGSEEIKVDKINPIAVITVDNTNVLKDEPISFDGSGSSDEGGSDSINYLWDFGDETPTSNEENPEYSYSETGTYTVTLTVEDAAGNSNTTTVEISVYEYGIFLTSEKWNLISIPLVPEDDETGIVDVISTISEHVNKVWSYQEGEWKVYSKTGQNSLINIKPGFGYYISMDEDDTLYQNGKKMYGDNGEGSKIPYPPVVTLTPSWNLIGHYGTRENIARDKALKTIEGSYATIFDKDGDSVYNFYPTEGYWLFLTGTDSLDYAPSDEAYDF